jgi:hypothetical protein
MSDPYEIEVAACRGRQKRLLAEMQRLAVDLVIVNKIEHVQWLAGPRFAATFEPAAALTAEGHLTLVSPNVRPEKSAADDSLVYDAKWLSTMRNDQREASSKVLLAALANRHRSRRVGVEYS